MTVAQFFGKLSDRNASANRPTDRPADITKCRAARPQLKSALYREEVCYDRSTVHVEYTGKLCIHK